jgi:hypothetical protein
MFLEILSLIAALFICSCIYLLEAHSVSSLAYQKLEINVNFEAQISPELHAKFRFPPHEGHTLASIITINRLMTSIATVIKKYK